MGISGLAGFGIAKALGLNDTSSSLTGIGAAAGFAVGGPLGAVAGGATGARPQHAARYPLDAAAGDGSGAGTGQD